MKNSHIQLSKGHMKPFSSGTDVFTVFKLDIESKVIEECDIKYIDTELGHYSDVTETAMNNEFENRFFSLRQRLVDLFEGKKTRVVVREKDRITIINFVNLAILRSKKTLDIVNESSVSAKILGGFNNDFLVSSRIDGILKENAFENYQVLVLKNNSCVNFVLPANSYYFTTNLYRTHIAAEFLVVIPLTPKISLLLLPYENNRNFIEESRDVYMNVDEENDIKIYNRLALQTELLSDRKFIISKTKSELIELLECY